MLLRRLYVFFIVLLLVSVGFHMMKRMDVAPRAYPNRPLYNTPVLLGYGPIQGIVKGQGRFHHTQAQVGRRRGRGRRDPWDLEK